MEINVQFANDQQRSFYYATERNQCFSGGFNNGKTFIGCMKDLILLLTFKNYRTIIAREKYTDLRRTTMETFHKMCPTELIESHNSQEGVTKFKSSSLVYWMHLDAVDENSLRGIEPNSILVDQAEETQEKVYDVLDSRVGRWDGAIIPDHLLERYGNQWPLNKQGRPIAPSYLMLLTNPDTQFHYIYRKYHPDSLERLENHFYVEGEWDSTLGSVETYNQAIKRDPEWVDKYVRGKWGRSTAQIHYVSPASILDYNPDLLDLIKKKGNLFRVLDHGNDAPTCCLWFAAINGVFICYREYYVPGKVISYHRQAITDLSESEEYSNNYADPSIFDKISQKKGGFWTIADEYRTSDTEGPELHWIAADNNEFATRNRINELLLHNNRFKHPTTGESPAPGIYYIKRSPEYPYGCFESIRQLGLQRKKLLGTLDGKSYYSDDRDNSIIDHAYDCTRYFVAMHGTQPKESRKKPARNTFAYYNMLLQRQQGMVSNSVN